MDYLPGLLALLGTLFVSNFFLTRWQRKRTIPFPPGPEPRFLTGNLKDIPAKQPWVTYTEWGARYGGIVHAKVFGQHVVLVNSLKIASDLFEKRSHIYSDRPVVTMIELMGWDFNVGLMPYGARWRQHRRIFQQSFRRDISVSYRSIQMTKIHDFLRGLLSSPQDFVELYKTVSASMILKLVYDIDIEPVNDHFVTLSESAVKKLGESVFPGAAAVNAFPALRHLPAWLPGCGFQRFAAECRQLTAAMQEVPFQFVRQKMLDGTGSRSIVAKLLEANHARGDSKDVEQAIKELSATAYAAGSDTTASALGSFFFAMATHPLAQKKAQNELDTVIGTHRLPDFQDRPSLPYVEALYREVMRWKPVLPLGVAHAASEDDVYEGHFIPKGATVMSNIWAMTRDEDVYPEPNRFNPDRFFTPEGKLNSNDTILAFGFGRRICVGRHTADATVWACIVSVLSTFNIEKAKDSAGNEIDISPAYSDSFVSHPEPFQCSITPRSEAKKKLIQQTAQ